MDVISRIEDALHAALVRADNPACPPKLQAAMRHAVFPRGARVRSRLCLAVASACGDDAPALANSAAAAIELLHCASLVHDDLPCFDDADIRRGRPSVHRAFGAPLAVLAGDALIVLAFQVLATGAATHPARLAGLIGTIGASVGVPSGIVAGQAWECEDEADVSLYQRQKTGSLFAASTMAGALSAGADPHAWRAAGMWLGEAYQVADDILDVLGTEESAGKPVAQDQAHHRPSMVASLGLDGAMDRLRTLAADAADALPPCRGRTELGRQIRTETMRLVPESLALHAA